MPLKPEVAEKQLEPFKVANAEAKLFARVKTLPKALAGTAFGLLGRHPDGKDIKGWKEDRAARKAAVTAIDAMSAAQRAKLFAGYFPHLGKHFAAAWDMFPRLPYQEAGDRRAFRAPNSPELYHERKADWFRSVLGELDEYNADKVTLDWLAQWAAYLGYGGADDVGLLLAAAIDAGGKDGEAVLQTLKDSAAGQHPVGAMGRHVTRALLVSSRPDAWEYVEKLLLAAQRQEGLRQSILETVDEAHPTAFKRMVNLLLDKDLVRFSSVVRAVDVWFGLSLDVLTPAKVKQALRDTANFLKDPKVRKAAVAGDDLSAVHLALMCAAFDDVADGIALAAKLTKDKNSTERRLLGVHFLESLNAVETVPLLVPVLDDPEPQVAAFALSAIHVLDDDEVMKVAPDLFERVEKLVARMPAKTKAINLEAANVTNSVIDRDDATDLLANYLGKRPKSRLMPHIRQMSTWRRANLVEEMAKAKTIDATMRSLFFELVGDSNDSVRESALKAVGKCSPTPAEVQALEPMLTRKTESVRRGVVSLIVKQKAAVVQEAADRLVESKNANVRLAGLEVLRHLAGKEKTADEAKAKVTAFRDAAKKLTADEKRIVEQLLKEKKKPGDVVGPHDAFGLCDLSKRTLAPKPVARNIRFVTPAAIGIVQALDKLIHEHRETPIKYKDYEGEQEEPLGAIGYGFPSYDASKPPEKQRDKLPLREVWEDFWTNRPKELRDKDGFELTRALALVMLNDWDWRRITEQAKGGLGKLKTHVFGDYKYKEPKYDGVVRDVVQWLHFLHPPAGVSDFYLDGLETIYANLTEDLIRVKKKKSKGRVYPEIVDFWRNIDRRNYDAASDAQKKREWNLVKWWDEPFGDAVVRIRPDLHEVLTAYHHGWATEVDVYDSILGQRGADEDEYDLEDFDDSDAQDPLLNARYGELQGFTAKSPPSHFKDHPELVAMADKVRAHLLDLELSRGDLPTPATPAAQHLGAIFGTDTLFRLFAALAGKPLKKGSRWGHVSSMDRTGVLTDLIEKTYPKPDETPESFAAAAKAAVAAGTLTHDRLLELAFSAPHWTTFVEAAVGWPGLSEGVWWFLAHMPGSPEGVEDEDDDDEPIADDDDETEDGEEKPEKLSAWEQLIRQRTPLTEEERSEGATDVAWFFRTHELVGAKNWAQVQAAAKYGGSGNDYKKPTMLADVLLGKAKKADIVNAIAKRRLRESVRLLGLMPMAPKAEREADLRERYEVLQEYAKYARSLGSMSRASAVRASEIGIANLARTAGYPDPIRFQWAMEAESVADLATGPQVVSVQGVTVSLALEEGKPVVTVSKNGKPLKAIPPAVKKHEKVAELTARKQHLTRQASRVRKSLEQMLARGDEFAGSELGQLMAHPLLSPYLTRLVLVGEGIAGYPVKGGKALEDYAGKLEPVKKDEKLRIAHPTDLFARGDWDKWQHDVFARERVQPFKQVFRELYLLTAQEIADGNVSHRYAAQQVQPRQGAALLNSRGWSTENYTRTFYEAGVRATFTVRHGGWTPLDVEGWTIEDIRFYRRDEWKPMPLVEVPPRVFSESMRDLDLVVSVAHMGQVDPEASASTVEMRASLIRETTQLLKMTNVRVEKNHALINGQLGEYTVHLGSGTVHRMPGGSVCIVPVHSQHRGRLFLPFADDDPRTAEVTSKVLMLARDNEIQDPSILGQLLNK